MIFLFDHLPSDDSVSNVPLSEVVLQALSAQSYAATTNGLLERWVLSRPSIREGGSYTITSHLPDMHSADNIHDVPNAPQFLVKMAGPTLEGHMEKDVTAIYVLPPDEKPASRVLDASHHPGDDMPYEIDEAFLENGLLSSLTDVRHTDRVRPIAPYTRLILTLPILTGPLSDHNVRTRFGNGRRLHCLYSHKRT